jgi:hypothetical protein
VRGGWGGSVRRPCPWTAQPDDRFPRSDHVGRNGDRQHTGSTTHWAVAFEVVGAVIAGGAGGGQRDEGRIQRLGNRADVAWLEWGRVEAAGGEASGAVAAGGRGGGALVAAAVAVWVTLEADFLAHREWLAAQKADFILGPVFVGLYWLRQRPESRFRPLLIGFGAVGAVYILQSSSNPWLFGTALHWESVIYLVNLALILTFPTGRLDGLAAKLILLAAVIAVVLPYAVVISLVPQLLGVCLDAVGAAAPVKIVDDGPGQSGSGDYQLLRLAREGQASSRGLTSRSVRRYYAWACQPRSRTSTPCAFLRGSRALS